MKIKNLGDPLTESFHIRLTSVQADYLNNLASNLCCTPSQVIRMMISSYLIEDISSQCNTCVYKQRAKGI